MEMRAGGHMSDVGTPVRDMFIRTDMDNAGARKLYPHNRALLSNVAGTSKRHAG